MLLFITHGQWESINLAINTLVNFADIDAAVDVSGSLGLRTLYTEIGSQRLYINVVLIFQEVLS